MDRYFPYEFKKNNGLVFDQPAVYKLHFGSKYFIFKGKTLKGSVEQNLRDIDKNLWSPKPGHIFTKICEHIHKGRVMKCQVEVVLQTTDPNLFLNTEQELLIASEMDSSCLNTKFVSHIPKWLDQELANNKPVIKKPNKAITATIIPERPETTSAEVKNNPEADSKPSDKINKLLAAYKNLNGSKKA